MLRGFTFICICYNQESLILDHLESIKDIVVKYGSGIVNDLIVADDCSQDNTVANAKQWIRENEGLFRNAEVLTSSENMGSVKNILRAVDECKTKEFKILAGDDKYILNDIYKLYDSLGDSIIVTPIIPFGEFEDKYKQLIVSFRRSYRLLLHYNSNNNIGELLRFRNYIFAPGVFINSDYWRSKEIRDLLSDFKYVEDFPMWMLLINEKRIPVVFEPQAFVFYRVNASTTLSPNKDLSIRQGDYDKLKEVFPQVLQSKSKYLHFSFYKHIVLKIILTYSRKYDGFFKTDEITKETYISSIQ